jgi:hypothetical protein
VRVLPHSCRRPYVTKHLHASVVGIRDIYRVVRANEDTVGQPELSLALAMLAHGKQQPPLFIENLNDMQKRVDNVYMPHTVRGYTFRSREITRPISTDAECTYVPAIGIKALQAKIQ